MSTPRSRVPPQNEPGATRGDGSVVRCGQLVVRDASQLANRLEGEVESVDVALPDEPAIGVARKRTIRTEVALGDKILGFTAPAEAERLELHEEDGREGVVD